MGQSLGGKRPRRETSNRERDGKGVGAWGLSSGLERLHPFAIADNRSGVFLPPRLRSKKRLAFVVNAHEGEPVVTPPQPLQ